MNSGATCQIRGNGMTLAALRFSNFQVRVGCAIERALNPPLARSLVAACVAGVD